MPFYNTVLQVMTVGGTKPSYNVDIYSGNHPFYQGGKTNAVMDEGMVRF
jgi:ribosomal protein L31